MDILNIGRAVSVTQSTREFQAARGQRMIAVAENLAAIPIVRDRVVFGQGGAGQGGVRHRAGLVRVGQVPILSIHGDVPAIASVSEPYPSLWQLIAGVGCRMR